MTTHFLREIDKDGTWLADHPFWDDGAREEIIGVPKMTMHSPAEPAFPGRQKVFFLNEVETPVFENGKPVWEIPPREALAEIPSVHATDEEGKLLWHIEPKAAIPANPIPDNMIEVPVPPGFGHPKWDGKQWVEGRDPVLLKAQRDESTARSIAEGVQKHLDDWAKARGYDSILSACSYAASKHSVFGAEGLAAVTNRDAVWQKCTEVLNDVKTGKRNAPKLDELIAELPPLVWPTQRSTK